MAVTAVTPRMQKALRDGRQLVFFADIWAGVLNDSVDSQSDFNAGIAQSNVDFTTVPGYARLATQNNAFSIQQADASSNYTLSNLAGNIGRIVFQRFILAFGRRLNKFTLKFNVSAGGYGAPNILISIRSSAPAPGSMDIRYPDIHYDSVLWSKMISPALGFSGDVDFVPDIELPAGTYWISVEQWTGNSVDSISLGCSTSKQYTDGRIIVVNYQDNPNSFTKPVTAIDTYDLYFKMECSGYVQTGYFLTKTFDLGQSPQFPGQLQITYDCPAGSQLAATLYGSTTGAFGGEETAFPQAEDGDEVPAGLRYWRVRIDMAASATRDQTPLVDMIELLFPEDRVRLRQKGALRNVADDILRDFQALLSPLNFQMSELKVIERVASGGSISAHIEDSGPDVIQRLVSNSPLKNFRAMFYLGADVPGFCSGDLLRFFIGIIDAATLAPKYRGSVYGLDLTVKNPILELKRKVPMPDQTGLVSFDTVAINHTTMHVMDSQIDLLRGQARIPARYVDLPSFARAKTTCGGGSPAAAAFLVRRSNDAVKYSSGSDAPDTRITSPEEVGKLLAPLALIADGDEIAEPGASSKKSRAAKEDKS